jgi:hypothetical protein
MSVSENQIVVYQPNETVRLDVRLENETVWLTQLKIAELFGVQKAAISKHIKHICDNVAIYQFPISSRGGGMTSEKQIAVQNVSPEKIQAVYSSFVMRRSCLIVIWRNCTVCP